MFDLTKNGNKKSSTKIRSVFETKIRSVFETKKAIDLTKNVNKNTLLIFVNHFLFQTSFLLSFC